MFLKICIKLIFLLCAVILMVNGYPYPLSEFKTDSSNGGESFRVQLLTRPLEEDSDFVLTTALLGNKATSDDAGYDENPNDLELAEVNVFRPVFRYRVSVSKKVKGPQF